MAKQHITEIFARKLAGEASAEELKELEKYLQENPGEQYFQEIINNWWVSKENSATVNAEQDDHFNYILSQAGDSDQEAGPGTKIITPVRKIHYRRFWKRIFIAASIAGILLFTTWSLAFNNKSNVKAAGRDNEIVAKRGTKSKLLLPDGTQVWLNSDSKLLYSDAFNTDSVREVTLDGEAFFDVIKNPKRPFIVHTSAITIHVLGTAFNVKSYAQEPTIEGSLVRGLIEVEKNNEAKASKIILKPNEKLVYNKEQDKISSSNTDKENGILQPLTEEQPKPQSISITTLPKNLTDSTRVETSWVYGKLLFEGDSFVELAQKMERWFNVKMIFNNDRVANYRFRGVFENENIVEALQALQLTAPFKFAVNGNEVIIDKK